MVLFDILLIVSALNGICFCSSQNNNCCIMYRIDVGDNKFIGVVSLWVWSYLKNISAVIHVLIHVLGTSKAFRALIPIAWLVDEDSLMCCIVTMGRLLRCSLHFLSEDPCFS